MAVKSANSKTYCYDASGRMTSRGGSAITWFSFDLPKQVNSGTQSAEFSYGVDRSRYKQVRRTGTTVDSTVLYLGDLVEQETVGSTVTWRHYVRARGRAIAQVNRVNTTNTVQYLHRDNLGSVVEVTSSTGTLVQSLAYDPWGLRRDATTWAALTSPFAGTQPTKRGYTGHEHIDNVELIHMNGRAQDPKIGLFISADPFVQAPHRSQSLNRYSFVWNNPLSFVDPSGFQRRPWRDDAPLLVDPPAGPTGPSTGGPSGVEETPLPPLVEAGGGVTYPMDQFTGADGRDLSTEGMPMPERRPTLEEFYEWHNKEREWTRRLQSTPVAASSLVPDERGFGERVYDMLYGVADSFTVGVHGGAQLSGKLDFFILHANLTVGMFDVHSSATGTWNRDVGATSPLPGDSFYAEASFSIGKLKLGGASGSVHEGTSSEGGPYERTEEGFAWKTALDARTWTGDAAKVGFRVQPLGGVRAEMNVGKALDAIGHAFDAYKNMNED